MLSKEKISFRLSVIALILSCLLSILFNEIPAHFRSHERLLSLIIILALCSPLLITDSLVKFRLYFLNYILVAITALVLVSFILLTTGIIPLSYPYNGITVHSMILGPMAALTFIFSIYSLLFKGASKILTFVIILSSLVMVMVSSSRSTILSLIVSFLFLLFKYNSGIKSGKIRGVIYVLLVIVISFPLWGNYLEGVQKKMRNNIERGSPFASRESIWKERLSEFKSSPIIGIGYASKTINKFDNEEKSQVELGSSYLGILSMTGLIGLISFLVIFRTYMIRMLLSKAQNAIMMGSIAVFLLIHMAFEGYILGSGNSLMLLFWLVMGCSVSIVEERNNIYDVIDTDKFLFT